MENPTSSNPNITLEMIEAGRFKITDVPGMMPSQQEIYQQAEAMAREMYPEKFRNMISPEAFDKSVAELHAEMKAKGVPMNWVPPVCSPEDERQATDSELHEAIAPSPISRLFAAVRAVLNHPAASIGDKDFTELRIAYNALGIDD